MSDTGHLLYHGAGEPETLVPSFSPPQPHDPEARMVNALQALAGPQF